jgi:hypothetical protein
MRKAGIAIAGALALASSGAAANVSDNVVKIAIADDMTGLYADLTGQGGVLAVRIRTRPTSPRRSRGNGTTSTRST